MLPKKNLMFWTNMDRRFVTGRQLALEKALQQLACVPAAFTRDDVLEFLGVPKADWAQIKGGAPGK